MGDADLVYTPLRRESCRQDNEGEEGLKIGEVGERDRVEVFCDKCGSIWDMTLG